MINKYFNYIILFLLLVVIFQGFYSTPEGITPEEEIYRLKIHDLRQEKSDLQLKNMKLHSQIYNFKNEILENDSIVDNSSIDQLDSMFTDYFKR